METETRLYSEGEIVVFGQNGICVINEIKSMSFMEGMEPSMFYVMSPWSNLSSTVFVPCDDVVQTSKLRKVMSQEEMDAIIRQATESVYEWIDDRMVRKKIFQEILNKGICLELLLVARCIFSKKQELKLKGKKLSSADDSILKSAEKLAIQEIAEVYGMDPAEVTEKVLPAMGLRLPPEA